MPKTIDKSPFIESMDLSSCRDFRIDSSCRWTPSSACSAPRFDTLRGPRYIRAVRIVGGEFGGRTLRAPRGAATRPTSDKVRQAVFNILGEPPPGARALDLYAGS